MNINIKRIHPKDKYELYAENLLDEDGEYYTNFNEWMYNNEKELKVAYIACLKSNLDDTVDTTFIEWSLEKWVIHNYNTLQEEISMLTNTEELP